MAQGGKGSNEEGTQRGKVLLYSIRLWSESENRNGPKVPLQGSSQPRHRKTTGSGGVGRIEKAGRAPQWGSPRTQRVATGKQDQTPPRAAHDGDRGTKRQESSRETSPNVKQQETNKGVGGYNGTENKQGAKRKDPRGHNTADQHQIQKDFRKKFHKDLKDLNSKEKASRGNEEPIEETEEEAQHPKPRGF